MLSRASHAISELLPLQIFNMLGTSYETVNILEDELLRSGMKEYSQWPTFPQVYIDGEFFGGCDILIGMNKLTLHDICLSCWSVISVT